MRDNIWFVFILATRAESLYADSSFRLPMPLAPRSMWIVQFALRGERFYVQPNLRYGSHDRKEN
jgi:hypothetical protein